MRASFQPLPSQSGVPIVRFGFSIFGLPRLQSLFIPQLFYGTQLQTLESIELQDFKGNGKIHLNTIPSSLDKKEDFDYQRS